MSHSQIAPNKQISLRELFLHIAFWSIYFLAEYLTQLPHLRTEDYGSLLKYTFLNLPLLMLSAYFILYILIPRFLKQGKNQLFFLSLLILAIALFFLRIRWAEWINYLEHDQYINLPATKVLKNLVRDYAVIALAVCLGIIADWKKSQTQKENLIRAKAEAEVQLLKSQLHPHFLFNTLNNIYSLALSRSEKTAQSILKLTELLDYFVYRVNKEEVQLGKEVQLLENYLELEKLRYGEDLFLEVDIQIKNEFLSISPLLLLPFIENCFKHGGKGKDGIFRVNISLKQDEKLWLVVENSKKQYPQAKKSPGGLGLENVRQRLHLLYPGKHQLLILEREDLYRSELSLHLG
ncbi:MAG: histidine kinase [Bacteroidia bacterium]|nr:histidine kinase [Bacteroidia bacterium]